MAERTYAPGLKAIARVLCLYMSRWSPKLRARFEDNEDLITLLDAIEAICATAEVILDSVIEEGD